MTEKQVRALALSLPEAVELPHMERTSFRVGGRIFATMTADGAQAVVFVAPRERLYALAAAQPDSFELLGGWSRMGALGVVVKNVDPAQLEELMVASWRKRAPKRAQAAYDGPAPAAKKKSKRV